MTEFPKPPLYFLNGMRIIEIPYETRSMQVKQHRKWRTNKKWKKIYGYKIIPVIEDKIYVADLSLPFGNPQKVIYATRGAIEMIKRECKQQ